MVYNIFYTTEAQKDLERIDKSVAIRILKKLDYFMNLADPFTHAKQLSGFEIPTFRFRIGEYRVVFRKDQRSNSLIILVILKIAHRKKVYKKL